MRKKIIAGLVAGLGLTLMLSACGGSAEDSDSPSSSWTLPDKDPEATIKVVGIVDPEAEKMKDVVAAFEKEHPTIDVEYQFVPFDDLNSVLDSRITSKTGDPDVFWVDQPRVPALSARGYLEDLTEQFGEQTEALQSATVESSSYDGKLFTLPISNSSQGLYYNKKLLAKAGVTPPSTNPDERITWQQLKKDAKSVQDKASAQYGLMVGQPNRYYQLQPLPSSAGGGVGASGEKNLTPEVNNEAWVESMEFYGSLFADKVSPRGIAPEQTNATFLEGKTAYIVEGNWMAAKLAESDLEWGAALHPVWEGGEPVTPTGSWSVGMNPFSKEKEAAAVFMKWLAIDGESGYAQHRAYAELPANKEGLKSYLASDVFTGSEGGKQAAAVIAHETENTAQPRVATIGYIEFEEIIGRAFSDISNGTDPKKALDSAQSQIETAWQQYE